MGSGGEVYLRAENYKKEDAIPVVVVDEEKEKTHKIGCITLYTKFFAVTGPVS